jgi:prevent-host-death family protein
MAADTGRKATIEAEDDVEIDAAEEGIPLKQARTILGELVARAGFGNEQIVITKNGKQTAALVGMRDLERLRQLDGAA